MSSHMNSFAFTLQRALVFITSILNSLDKDSIKFSSSAIG